MTHDDRTRGSYVPHPSRGVPAGPRAARLPAGAAAEAYMAAELATAPPRRLQTVLYDEAIRICRQALAALDAGAVERAAEHLGRASTIVLHLQAALQTRAAPDLSRELAELYQQVHRRLIEADYYRKRETLQESIQLLHRCRPALTAFLEALHRPGHGASIDTPSWVG